MLNKNERKRKSSSRSKKNTKRRRTAAETRGSAEQRIARERLAGETEPSVSKIFTANNAHDFFQINSNSPTSCSYPYRSSCSVGCLSDFFPAPFFPSAVPFFSHNFNNTTVIIPPITAPNIAPFQNSSEGNILLVCPDQAKITLHALVSTIYSSSLT